MPENIPQHWVLEVQERLGRLSEQMINAAEHRLEVMRRLNELNDKTDLLSGDVRNVEQTIKSQSALLTPLLLEKCGERLTTLENTCKDLPVMLDNIRFWEKVIGGGIAGLLKVAGLLIASGAIGATINHFWNVK